MPSTRSRPLSVSAREGLLPSGGTTIHAIGDVHAGAFETLAVDRRGKLTADLIQARLLPVPVAQVFTGDIVNTVAAEDAIAQSWIAGMPALPRYYACGNHDVWAGFRTGAAFASSFGMPGVNYIVDLPDLRLVVVGPDTAGVDPGYITLPPATITWMAQQIEAAPGDVMIVCHAPLAETVLGDNALVYTTRLSENVFTAVNQGADASIREVLADYPQCKAWLAGHTHSPMTTPGMVISQTFGAHDVAMINTSAIAFTGRAYKQVTDLVATPFITWLGDRVEVRWRNHGAGVWDGPDGVRVLGIDL